MTFKPALFVAFGATALLGACASAPNQNLVAARQAYAAASQDPAVVRDAPLELQRSRTALQSADAAAKDDDDSRKVDYYAYLATRHAQIAEQEARLDEAQKTVQNADAARAQALLQTRTQEAAQARQRAMTERQRAETAQQDAARARERASHLQQQLEALKNDRANQGMVLTLGSDILFDVDGSQLKPGALGTIEKVAQYLKQHPGRTLVVDGYTDSTGTPDYNLRLSQLRAAAVRSALIQDGVAADRITTKGYGETAPVATNATSAGRQLNRRVQLAISGPNGAPPPAMSGSSEPAGDAGSSESPAGSSR